MYYWSITCTPAGTDVLTDRDGLCVCVGEGGYAHQREEPKHAESGTFRGNGTEIDSPINTVPGRVSSNLGFDLRRESISVGLGSRR